MENHLNRPEIQLAQRSGEGASTRFSASIAMQMVYHAVAVKVDGQTAAFVRLATPLERVNQDVSALRSAVISVALLVSLLAGLAAIWIAASTTRPLRQLTDAARRMASGDFQGRINPTTADEISDLARAFNHLSNRLAARIQELEGERSKLAAVLNEMSDGVVIVDPQGRVGIINAAAQEMFSVQAASVAGHTLAEALRYHQVVELWQLTTSSGELHSYPMELSADRLYLQAAAVPMGAENPGYVILLFQNLTRTRYLETVRRDFISNISHELRTPLASLKALTETLQEGALEDPPAARRFLQRIETEVDALSQMVNELLELSRIESGKVPLQMRPVSPLEIIQISVDRLHLQAERAGLQVTIDCPADLPHILADPLRLEQVLGNLLHNAIKFTATGGNIRLSARLLDADSLRTGGIPLGGCESGSAVLFTVEDTGSGIHPDDLPRIFERFYKADRARSTGGTGLGLAIARHTIEAHSGRIWAQSVEGSGSTFFFCIPVA
jgi:two-component system phosphate regulon sensor histidine kinase PhoR